MDASVLVGAIFGLAGTVAGGGLSIVASIAAQRQQAKASRDLVVAQRVDAAADSAIQLFFQIKQHVRGRPRDYEQRADERLKVWDKALQAQVSKLEPTLMRIRNPEFRLRLQKVAEYLAWPEVTVGELEGSPAILGELCDHALECLGAFVRDERLPQEGVGLARARRVDALYCQYMEEQAEDWETQYGHQ